MTEQKALKLTVTSEGEGSQPPLLLAVQSQQSTVAGFPQKKTHGKKIFLEKKLLKILRPRIKYHLVKTNVDQKQGLMLIRNIWNVRLLGDSQYASEEANSKPVLLVSVVDCLQDDDFGYSSCGVTPWVKEGDTSGGDAVPGAGSSCGLG